MSPNVRHKEIIYTGKINCYGLSDVGCQWYESIHFIMCSDHFGFQKFPDT